MIRGRGRAAPGHGLLMLGAALLICSAAAACSDGDGSPAGSPAPGVEIGAGAGFGDVRYVAFGRVGFDRLPRDRVEEAGEARIEAQARRVPAYRLLNSSKAALRYTDDDGRGWVIWQPEAVLYARRELARRENVQPAQIQTMDVTAEQWPDSCLGVGRPEQTCLQVVVPGFRIVLRLANRTYEYHTDQSGQGAVAVP